MQVMPSIAIIQVGKDNSYNLPNQETIDKLNAVGTKIYRTDAVSYTHLDVYKRQGILYLIFLQTYFTILWQCQYCLWLTKYFLIIK